MGNCPHRQNYEDKGTYFYIPSSHWRCDVASSYERAAMLLARWVDEDHEPRMCQEVEQHHIG
jgi:hypothetical protein